VRETHDASSFVLDIPQSLTETFRYQPGQFCTFRVHVEGEEQLRSYSMSSAPALDDELTVTVKRVAGGLVSNWLLDHVRAGDVIEATRPAGVFTPQESARPLVGLCGGSGVTPIMSITKAVLAGTDRTIRLLYANRDRASVIFGDSLTALSGLHPDRLEVMHHFDADGGFLTTEAVADVVGSLLDADFYVCGPGPFMDLVESTLLRLGVTPDRIFIERFLVDQQEKTDALIDQEATAGGGAVPAVVTVKLGGKTSVINYRPGDTLLETARRGGLRPPFSCEAGNCATCMAMLEEGSVTMRVNNALTPEEVEEGWVLTCQSLPSSETIVVEYEAM
jgi:ferredoxin-NADP reductase